MEKGSKKIKINQRNYFEALNHILNTECIPAFKMLCQLLNKEERRKKDMIVNRRAIARGFGNIPILKRALVCLLCIRIANIFVDNHGISFKKLGIKLQKEKIIEEMIKTRHTWFGHISKQINNIVSAKEICNSNLLKKFKDLSNLLVNIYVKDIIDFPK